jgi:putative ABC transport system permease protein
MSLWNVVSVGFKEIWAYKFRSLLTMLGIILGVSSLVAMSALVKGMEIAQKEGLVAIGGLQKVRIEASDVPIEQRHLADQAVGITINDVYALRNAAPLVTALSPEMRLFGATLAARGKTFRPFTCAGVWPVALEMSEHTIAHGRMFNSIDDEMARSVCVIGTATRDALFGAPDEIGYEVIPIGETILINRQPFTIVGMFTHYESEQERRERELAKLQPKPESTGTVGQSNRGRRRGNFIFWLKNATVYVPLNTMWMKFRSGMPGTSGATGDPALSTLEVKIADIEAMESALQQIRNVMLTTHKGIEDFSFRTQEEWAENINTFIRNTRLSGGMIAGISLLVGGIGIMNIMLASISGRIREIGIRKAVGADTGDVFVQILVESLVIAILGGLAGLLASYLFVQLIQYLSPDGNPPIITALAMVVAFSASVAIGIAAGLFPAFKASRYHPIQALRYE